MDIDPQAVEVTKLSLLLKVLEGESHESLESQRRIWHERALPDLASNIKCGNSLIGPDFWSAVRRGLRASGDPMFRASLLRAVADAKISNCNMSTKVCEHRDCGRMVLPMCKTVDRELCSAFFQIESTLRGRTTL